MYQNVNKGKPGEGGQRLEWGGVGEAVEWLRGLMPTDQVFFFLSSSELFAPVRFWLSPFPRWKANHEQSNAIIGNQRQSSDSSQQEASPKLEPILCLAFWNLDFAVLSIWCTVQFFFYVIVLYSQWFIFFFFYLYRLLY